MDPEELRKRLLGTFAGELEEHVRALNTELLALENEAMAEQRQLHIRNLFRAAHSLKGAAQSVGAEVIATACHSLEDLFGSLRGSAADLDRDTFQLLFNTVDAIAEAGTRLRTGDDLARSPLSRLLPSLEETTDRPSGVRPANVETARPAAPVPESMTGSWVPARPDQRSVRVSVEKLDSLVSLSGELLVARRRLGTRQNEADRLLQAVTPCLEVWKGLKRQLRGTNVRVNGSGLTERIDEIGRDLERLSRLAHALSANIRVDSLAIEQAASPLDEAVRRTRMLPFATACEGLDRMARDLARDQGKFVDLQIVGGEVELDRDILDRLRDPLMHLVRNAVDHGVEPSADRRAAGKRDRAIIQVTASLASGRVEIVVEDDGRGLDIASARQRAEALNLSIPPDDNDALSRVVFIPGFTTAERVTDVSGRGVGLDVVKSTIEALRGSVSVSFLAGRGARFVLSVPLTLSALRALLLKDAETTYAVEDASIVSLRRIGVEDVRSIEGRQVLPVDGGHIPIVSLSEVLGVAGLKPDAGVEKRPVVIIEAGDQQVAVVVDELFSEQDIVVKPLGPRLAGGSFFVGATLLVDGEVALIVNPATLVEVGQAAEPLASIDAPAAGRRRRLLLADDSVTVRTLEKSIMEAAGYEVVAVADGMEAWQLLQDVEFDLLVSDIEMPRMDGVALTQRIRATPRLRALPVILVTGLKDERDRMRGLEAGADAYVVKSAFDQADLLAAIERLTGEQAP